MKKKFLQKKSRRIWPVWRLVVFTGQTNSRVSMEQFSIVYRKTNVITLANHNGRSAIHCPIKTQSNYTKGGKTCASKSRLLLVLLLIG